MGAGFLRVEGGGSGQWGIKVFVCAVWDEGLEGLVCGVWIRIAGREWMGGHGYGWMEREDVRSL